jgi:hypothetical protein
VNLPVKYGAVMFVVINIAGLGLDWERTERKMKFILLNILITKIEIILYHIFFFKEAIFKK